MKKPNWFLRKWRRLLGHCPYCNKKLRHGLITAFLHGFFSCPDGHYAEEDVMGAGTIIYDRGGESIFPPDPVKPILRVVNGGR